MDWFKHSRGRVRVSGSVKDLRTFSILSVYGLNSNHLTVKIRISGSLEIVSFLEADTTLPLTCILVIISLSLTLLDSNKHMSHMIWYNYNC